MSFVRSWWAVLPIGRLISRSCLPKIALACAGCFLANLPAPAAPAVSASAAPLHDAGLQRNETMALESYLAAGDAQEANLSYPWWYWLDEAYRTADVLILRYGWRKVEVEGSVAKKKERETDHLHIDTSRLFTAASGRLFYRPAPDWLLQISRNRLDRLDQTSPDNGIRRTMVSANYSHAFSRSLWETTLAYGRGTKKTDGGAGDSYLIESLWQIDHVHTVFGKLERAAADELFSEREALYGQTFNANKLTLGYVHGFMPAGRIKFDIGGLASKRFISQNQAATLGANPVSYKIFVRLVLSYP